MEEINKRVLELRMLLKMTQPEFGEKIGLVPSGISAIERGDRSVTKKHVKLITTAFNVHEEWLLTGEGEVFIPLERISLDEYAKVNELSELETEILKTYMGIPKEIRREVLDRLTGLFIQNEQIKAMEQEKAEVEAELERYRQELLAEKRGRISSASVKRRGQSS